MACCRFLLTWTLIAVPVLTAAGQGQPPASDLQGDPLPAGAVVRLGSVRWRHDHVVAFAAFLPDGKAVVSVGCDWTIRVWEFPSGKVIRNIAPPPNLNDAKDPTDREMLPTSLRLLEIAVALSKDGKTIATWFGGNASTNQFLGAQLEGRQIPPIRLHDVATGKELAVLKTDGRGLSALIFAPTGERLMSISWDGTMTLWDWANAKRVRTIAAKDETQKSKPLKTASPNAIPDDKFVYAPDGKSLLIYGSTNVLEIIDLQNGQRGSAVHSTALTAVQFSPDGKHLFTQAADNSVFPGFAMHKWDAQSGKDLGILNLRLKEGLSGLRQIVSPDGQIAVKISIDREVTLFDPANGKAISKLTPRIAKGLDLPLQQLVFSADSKMLATVSSVEQKIDLYDVHTGKQLQSLTNKSNAAPQPGNPPVGGFRKPAPTIIFSFDNRNVAAILDSKTALLWDTATGNQVASLSLPGPGFIDNGTFTSDGRCLAFDMNDGTVAVYELATAKLRRTFGKKKDGLKEAPLAATGFGKGKGTESRWAQPSPRVAVSPDGKSLACAGPDRLIHVWDIVSGKALASFKGHSAKVKAIAFAPDGKTLASASDDTTALVWDMTKLERAVAPKKVLQPAEMAAAWEALADSDAAKAFAAMCDLAGAQQATLALIQKELKPAAAVGRRQVDELIAKLDSDQYKVREKATNELLKIGKKAVPAIADALAKQPALETKTRLQELRAKLTSAVMHGDRLRDFRSVELLEQIGTPAARQVLQGLAEGDPEALITSSARSALKRLGGRP